MVEMSMSFLFFQQKVRYTSEYWLYGEKKSLEARCAVCSIHQCSAYNSDVTLQWDSKVLSLPKFSLGYMGWEITVSPLSSS